MEKKYIGSKPTNKEKQRLDSVGKKRAARYNNTVMDDNIALIQIGFSKKLAILRTEKGVSAREMSLSLGENPSYINDIENARSFPSMAMFFEICEYLGTKPEEFFECDQETEIIKPSVYIKEFEKLSHKDKLLIVKLTERLLK